MMLHITKLLQTTLHAKYLEEYSSFVEIARGLHYSHALLADHVPLALAPNLTMLLNHTHATHDKRSLHSFARDCDDALTFWNLEKHVLASFFVPGVVAGRALGLLNVRLLACINRIMPLCLLYQDC